jgi:hypothetical protein
MYTDDNTTFLMLYDKYKDIYDNPSKKELIHVKTEKMYEIMGEIKEKMEEYKKNTLNVDLLADATDIHIQKLIPIMKEIQAIKYRHMDVICDDETDKCQLVQNEHIMGDFIQELDEPKIIKFIA